MQISEMNISDKKVGEQKACRSVGQIVADERNPDLQLGSISNR
jgi:hypothetical protein